MIIFIVVVSVILLAVAFRAFLFLLTWGLGLVGFAALLYSRGEPDVDLFPFITIGAAFLLDYIRPKFNIEEVTSHE